MNEIKERIEEMPDEDRDLFTEATEDLNQQLSTYQLFVSVLAGACVGQYFHSWVIGISVTTIIYLVANYEINRVRRRYDLPTRLSQ